MPHMMVYVSRFTKLTWMTPDIFRDLVHSELSNLPLMCTHPIGATDFVDSYYYPVSFQHFDYRRSQDSVTDPAVCFGTFSISSWLHLGVPNLTALLQDWTRQSFISCFFNVFIWILVLAEAWFHLRARLVWTVNSLYRKLQRTRNFSLR